MINGQAGEGHLTIKRIDWGGCKRYGRRVMCQLRGLVVRFKIALFGAQPSVSLQRIPIKKRLWERIWSMSSFMPWKFPLAFQNTAWK